MEFTIYEFGPVVSQPPLNEVHQIENGNNPDFEKCYAPEIGTRVPPFPIVLYACP